MKRLPAEAGRSTRLPRHTSCVANVIPSTTHGRWEAAGLLIDADSGAWRGSVGSQAKKARMHPEK